MLVRRALHGMSLTYIDPTESSHVVDALSDITSDDQAPSIGAKWLAMEISRTFTDYVCVVIADDEVAEDTVRQSLHTALPIHVTRWQGQAYLADIRELRPRMIVVLGKDDVLAQEQAELVATLFARGEPTVVSGTASARLGLGCHLVIHRLGSAAKARVDAIRDVLLLPN